MRPSRPYTYLGTVQGMCRECRALVPARVLEEEGAVYQERLCPRCGSARARLADRCGVVSGSRAATTVRCKPGAAAGDAGHSGMPARLRPLRRPRQCLPSAGVLSHQRLQHGLPDLLHL